MKILVNIIIILIISSSNPLSLNSKNSLPSGWYLITENKNSISINLDKTEKTYKIEKDIFISINHILSVELATARYSNKDNPILNFTLDNDARLKLASLSDGSGARREMGLVINSKLIQVSTIFGKFSGNKMSMAGKFTKEELLKLKENIDLEKG